MSRHLLCLAAALCLSAGAPHALANGKAEDMSFQDISRRALSDRMDPSLITVSFHREWGTAGNAFRNEWVVATTSPDRYSQLEEVVDLWLNKKHPPRDVSWAEAMHSDWGNKVGKRWGKEIGQDRPAVEAWMERYCMTAIPEPGTLAMLLGGLGLLVATTRNRRRQS